MHTKEAHSSHLQPELEWGKYCIFGAPKLPLIYLPTLAWGAAVRFLLSSECFVSSYKRGESTQHDTTGGEVRAYTFVVRQRHLQE